MIPRSVRNFNPGNINSGEPWQGLQPRDRMNPDQRTETRFAVFSSPEWGFGALITLLRNYKRLYSLNTVAQIIARWAPPNENDTVAYKTAVARECGVTPDQVVDANDRSFMFHLAKAITRHETGLWEPWWHDSDLNKGLDLAGY